MKKVFILIVLLSSFVICLAEDGKLDSEFLSPDLVEALMEMDSIKAVICSRIIPGMFLILDSRVLSDSVSELSKGHILGSFDFSVEDISILCGKDGNSLDQETRHLFLKLVELDESVFREFRDKVWTPFLKKEELATFDHGSEPDPIIWFILMDFMEKSFKEDPSLRDLIKS